MTRIDVAVSRRHALLLGLAMTAPFGASNGFAQAAEFEFKWGHAFPVGHSINIWAEKAAAAVQKRTNGRVKIQVFPSSQLGSDSDMLSQARSGALEMYMPSTTTIEPLVRTASIYALPFLFTGIEDVRRVCDGSFGAKVNDAIMKAGLHVFQYTWDVGNRHITNSRAPITDPTSLAGLKIRVPTSPVLISTFAALGAAPVAMNVSELYTSLQTHVVDGQENPLEIIHSGRYFEVQKYCSLTAHVFSNVFLVFSGSAWRRLPEDLKTIVAEEVEIAAKSQRELAASEEAAARQKLDQAGMIFNSPDRMKFRQALIDKGFYKTVKEKYPADLWTALEVEVGKLG